MDRQYVRSLVTTIQATLKSIRSPLTRAWVLGLLLIAVATAPVSAAVVQTNLTSQGVRETVRAAVEDLVPALHSPVDKVAVNSLQLLVETDRMEKSLALKFHQVFILGQAPANQPQIATWLSLPEAQRTAYSLQQLTQAGALSQAEAQLLQALRNAADEEVRGLALAALAKGEYGLVATAILQVTTDLTAIDTESGLETCAASASSLRTQGWLGNALKWLGGLAKAVLGGAIDGAMIGFWLGGTRGAVLGAIGGGIWAGGKYIGSTTGNGFMPGPNGEDCTGWPHNFPAF